MGMMVVMSMVMMMVSSIAMIADTVIVVGY